MCVADSGNIESTSIRKNAEIRHKRLHKKVLKEMVQRKNTKLNNNELQIRRNNVPSVPNTTKDKLIEQAKEILCEEMDWEPTKDEEITLEVIITIKYCDNNLNIKETESKYKYFYSI